MYSFSLCSYTKRRQLLRVRYLSFLLWWDSWLQLTVKMWNTCILCFQTETCFDVIKVLDAVRKSSDVSTGISVMTILACKSYLSVMCCSKQGMLFVFVWHDPLGNPCFCVGTECRYGYKSYILYHANCNICRYELWFIFVIIVTAQAPLQLEVDSHCDALLCFLVWRQCLYHSCPWIWFCLSSKVKIHFLIS